MRVPRWAAWAIAGISCAATAAIAFEQTTSPYVGQERRAVKALSPEEARGLLEGRGMGLAKAAELNRYPGPKHVLELAQELELNAAQRATAQAIFDRMDAHAKRLGAAILEKEAELDRRFAAGMIDAPALQAATTEIARLQGELRAVHLRAHVDLRPVLTDAQVERYIHLRGYDSGAPHVHTPGHVQH